MTTAELNKLLHTEQDSPVHKQQKETSLQSQCVKYFRTQYPLLAECMTHMKNEEPDAKRRKIGAAMGVVPGYPDLMLFMPADYWLCDDIGNKVWHHYNALALELKNGKAGHQSPAQKLCEKRMKICGYKYCIIRTLDEFIEAVDNYAHHLDMNMLTALQELQKEQEQADTIKARKELSRFLQKA